MAVPVTFDLDRPPVFQRAHVFLRVGPLVVIGWLGDPFGLLWFGLLWLGFLWSQRFLFRRRADSATRARVSRNR